MTMILWNLVFLCWNTWFAVSNWREHDLVVAVLFAGLVIVHVYFGARATQFYLWSRQQERKP